MESGAFEEDGGPVFGRGGQVLPGGDAVGDAVRGEERAQLLVEGARLVLASSTAAMAESARSGFAIARKVHPSSSGSPTMRPGPNAIVQSDW